MNNPPKKATRRPRGGSPLAVGAYVPGIARKVFETHGFSIASILTDWPEIIGQEFAGITAPERIAWPRGADPEENRDDSGGGSSGHRPRGATLMVRVDGPRALEVQHMAPQLLERINTYFGYRAVSELRILQGPVRPASEPAKTPGENKSRELPQAAGIEDERLRDALSRLAGSIE